MPTLNNRLATHCEGLRVWSHPILHNANMDITAELQTFKTRTVAEAFEVHPNTIRRLIKAGELTVVWISKTDQRVNGKSLAKHLERRKVKPCEEKRGGKVAATVTVTENVKSRTSQVLERLGLRQRT
jgi:prolyl-tRNA editing enzyme YbaK/EbsC (Cys-tRNA(Pro) deacylase)